MKALTFFYLFWGCILSNTTTSGIASAESLPHSALQHFKTKAYIVRCVLEDTTSNKTSALLEDPKGVHHVATLGNYIGKSWGKITKITQESVEVSEEFTTIEGKRITKKSELVPEVFQRSLQKGSKAINLHCHDADVHGIFRISTHATSENIFIPNSVVGRSNISLSLIQKEKLIIEVASNQNLKVSKMNGLTIIGTTNLQNKEKVYSSTKVNIDVYKTQLSSLIGLFNHLKGTNYTLEKDTETELSIYAKDQPSDLIFDATIQTLGLEVPSDTSGVIKRKK
jgi:hypothetical protein